MGAFQRSQRHAAQRATAGFGYKVTPNVLLGLFGGYENFRSDFASVSGRLKGDGGTAGGYAAWRIIPTLRWDAMLGWSKVAYDASAGAASGSFTGAR
ncbi:MAG: autotransporter outer membrane beta-barrel domain-containing protein [Xanthobacteraceae bacterium]|nr:autotransporter outer membrane beta-barrel domain-containing protein [Xanthobacteraceae bacterium]